ncbi:Gfo/Idh/MocA family oxidoreductase [Sphingobacterium sp. InxBP1]|uniref:Gfo/Idh/MocA family protein n=1 Tax=Sphingobacterium sp. InxBP1 TaxID=2870328 RepID=UPI0022435FA8|nr:Gfo/Idh/MocA family oxidoreductase [Sphingobacterium sp. InxBP1]MCW8310902.1 Gfo/Idh/MocA family oxidoreductase [Sphingobacterium sp. InxBP1]
MKVLIVGLGSIAKKHIEAMRRQIENIEYYALRRGNTDTASVYQGVTNLFSLEDFDLDVLDFVIISNPTHQHYDTIKTCIAFKKPLFIEKPLFSELTKDTEELVKKVLTSGVITYVACNLRFLDAIKQLKGYLEGKRINEVNVYCGSNLPEWRPNVDFRKVYSANKEMGGGVHIDLIHELDYVYWFFGKPTAHRSLFRNVSSLDISAVDYANYIWEYPMFTASIVLNYYRKDPKRTMEVVTSDGTYLADLLNNVIYFNGEIIFQSSQTILDTYDNQIRYFIDSIIGANVSFNTIDDANTILKLCIQD